MDVSSRSSAYLQYLHVSITAMQHMWGFLCPSISVSVQCCRPTHTSIFSVWAHHTDSPRPSLAAVLRAHQFQAGLAHLLTPAWSSNSSFRLHPVYHRLQSPSSQVVVILTTSNPTYMAFHCRWAYLVAGSRLWNSLPPNNTSAPTLTVFGNCLKTHLFINRFLPNAFQFLVLYNVCSGLAVLYLSHSI